QTNIEHYLEISELCEYRIEYHEGFIISFYENIFNQMFNHERIIFNFLLIIGTFIKSNKLTWEVLPSNILIYIHLAKPCAYKPDASIFKEKAQLMTYINPKDESKHKAGLNPYAIFEVLSPSTRSFDLREKLKNYKNITSVEQIIFAEKTKVKIIFYEKIGENWIEAVYENPNEVIFVADCPVSIADLYENVDFNE
ncbi:MAG: Uma2 family endonuclease, partial [Bacteroidetes bacterium]